MIGYTVPLNCHDVRASSELGNNERALLNIASLLEANLEESTCPKSLRDVIPMVCLSLPLPSLYGVCLECYGTYALPGPIWIRGAGVAKCTGATISSLNVDISRPKGIRHNVGNLGSPKGERSLW